MISRSIFSLIICTGGAYRPFLHDRHLSAASRFQIGVLRGRRIASSGMGRVLQRCHPQASYAGIEALTMVGEGRAGPP